MSTERNTFAAFAVCLCAYLITTVAALNVKRLASLITTGALATLVIKVTTCDTRSLIITHRVHNSSDYHSNQSSRRIMSLIFALRKTVIC